MEFNWDAYPIAEEKTGFDWDQYPEVKEPTPVMDKVKEFGQATLNDLPAIGAMGGSMMGGLPGAAVGGFAGKAGQNLIKHYIQPEEAPQTSSEYLTEPVIAGADAATGEMVGRKVGEGIAKVAPYLGEPLKKAYQAGKSKLGKVGDYILKKTGKIVHSLPEEYSEEYLKRKGKIDARPVEDIMEDLQMRHDEAKGHLSASEKAVLEAKDRVRESGESVRNHQQGLADQLSDQKFQAGIHHGEARGHLSEAAQTQKEQLKGNHVRQLVQPIQGAIQALKDKVGVESAESYVILGDAPGAVNTKDFLDVLKQGMEQLKLKGQLLTGTDAAAYKELDSLYSRLEEVGPVITFPEAKFILQRLGHDTKWTPNAGAFADVANQVKQNARRSLNQIVGEKVPKYKEQMFKVDRLTRLLKDLSQKFGTPELALSKLENIASQKGQHIDAQLLKDLGKEMEQDFSGPIASHIRSKEILSTPSKLRNMREQLPEHAVHAQSQAEMKRLSDPATRRAIKERVRASQEAKLHGESKEALKSRQADLTDAESKYKPHAPFGQGTVQAKVKALVGARNYAPKKLFKEIDQATGKNFTGEIRDRAILDSFQKTDTNGARKTLVGKAIGKGLGMLLAGGAGGAAAGGPGMAIGASIGFGMDKYSGQVLRAIFNKRIQLGEGIKQLEGRFGKYAPALAKAAEKGPEALSTLGAVLSQNPGFKKHVENLEKSH